MPSEHPEPSTSLEPSESSTLTEQSESSTLTEQSELARAAQAFERGDHRLAGELAARLADSPDSDVSAQARRLLFRLKTPGLSILIVLLTGFVLLAVTAAAYLKSR